MLQLPNQRQTSKVLIMQHATWRETARKHDNQQTLPEVTQIVWGTWQGGNRVGCNMAFVCRTIAASSGSYVLGCFAFVFANLLTSVQVFFFPLKANHKSRFHYLSSYQNQTLFFSYLATQNNLKLYRYFVFLYSLRIQGGSWALGQLPKRKHGGKSLEQEEFQREFSADPTVRVGGPNKASVYVKHTHTSFSVCLIRLTWQSRYNCLHTQEF